jgi:peroxiredoxin
MIRTHMKTSVPINEEIWKKLSKDQQEQIKKTIDLYRLVPGNVEFVPEATHAFWNFNPCDIACDTAQAAALVACNAYTDGLLFAACVAGANEAGKVCHDNCNWSGLFSGFHAVEPRNNLSLRRSRLTRGGLPQGAEAPQFTLPDIQGQYFDTHSLLGQYVLLVFSDPQCAPCNELAPSLEALYHRTPDIIVVMISRGSPEDNNSKVNQYRLTFPVLVQRRWEISMLYGIFTTPVAFLIDPQGVIASTVAIGPAAILGLLKAAAIQCLLTI